MALDRHQDLTQSEMMEEMGVSNGTIQERVSELKERNLIEEDASISDSGRPRKVYHLTDDGSNRAKKLRDLLEEKSD